MLLEQLECCSPFHRAHILVALHMSAPRTKLPLPPAVLMCALDCNRQTPLVLLSWLAALSFCFCTACAHMQSCAQVFAEGPQGGFCFACGSGAGGDFVLLQYSIEQAAGNEAVLKVTGRSAQPELLQHALSVWESKVGQHVASL